MLPFYVGALALGGALIAISIFFGGGDHDADGDADAELDVDHDAELDVDHDAELDVDHDAELGGASDAEVAVNHELGGDQDAALWLPFLSMRFWTFGLACFGLAGSLLSLLPVPSGVTAAASIFLGVSMGWLVAWVFRVLRKQNNTGEVSTQALQGSEASVLVSVGPEKMGKVRLLMGDRHVDLLARTHDGGLIVRGQKVLIVHVQDGIAEVTPYTADTSPRGRVTRSQTLEH